MRCLCRLRLFIGFQRTDLFAPVVKGFDRQALLTGVSCHAQPRGLPLLPMAQPELLGGREHRLNVLIGF